LADLRFLAQVKAWWKKESIQGKNNMHTFQLKLQNLKKCIKVWNKLKFGKIFEEKFKLEGKMQEIQKHIIALEG